MHTTSCQNMIMMFSLFANHSSFPNSPIPTAAKGSKHKLQCCLLHYNGGLLHCLEVLDIYSTVYDTDGIQRMIYSPHKYDDILEYLGCHMPN